MIGDHRFGFPATVWRALFLLPWIIWLWLHQWGSISPHIDNVLYAHWLEYHFSYLSQGVFPLWDPFRAWGWPNLTDPRSFGECNPLYLMIPLLTALQVPFPVAFNIFLCVFYFLGSLGFYLLLKCLWDDERVALAGHAMFTVSLLGAALFSQLALPLILFPTIWFYYFLLSFLKAGTPKDQGRYFVGLVFVVMIIVITYLPFFFLVVTAAVAVAVCVTRPALIAEGFRRTVRFIQEHPWKFWLGAAMVLVACLPGVIWYLSTSRGEIAFLTARNGFSASQGASVPLRMIETSSLASQVSLGEILGDQDFVMNTFCYVPIFPLVVLSLGFLTPMDSKKRMIFLAAFLVFVFALARATPVHAFLYQHVFFVRLFRNLYLLGPFLFVFLVMMAAGQLKSLLGVLRSPRDTLWAALYVLAVHGAWMLCLLFQERVLWSSYATVAGSLGVCLVYLAGKFRSSGFGLWVAVMALAMVQPGHLIFQYWKVWGQEKLVINTATPGFSYTRPLRGTDPLMEQGYGFTAKKKKDESGFSTQGYYGSRYGVQLLAHVPPEDLQEYVSRKFVLYDGVAFMDGEHPNWKVVGATLRERKGPAWVHDKRAVRGHPGAGGNARARVLTGPSDGLQVVHFDPNRVRLKTNFLSPTFLVFNDSYHPGWRVYIDGKQELLYRANVAFKGVWVGPGPRDVEFRFLHFYHYAFRWLLEGVFVGWFVYLVYCFCRGKR